MSASLSAVRVEPTSQEYKTSPDFNAATHECTINGMHLCGSEVVSRAAAHGGRVEGIVLDLARERLMSVGRDRTLRLHHSAGGALLSTLTLPHVPSCFVFDLESLSIFVGDTKGSISVLRLEGKDIKLLSVLEGHSGLMAEWA